MITASISPTRSLRDAGSIIPPERQVSTRLRDSQTATAQNPVVLMRGCTRIDLRVDLPAFHSPRITWTVTPLASNDALPAPGVFPPISMFTQLDTNAMGLFRVTATIAATAAPPVLHHWHVRFIDLRVPDDPIPNEGNLDLDFQAGWLGCVSAGATFGLTTRVVLDGAGDTAAHYDRVSVGILQNLYQRATDPGCSPLFGRYYRWTGNGLRVGTFSEPVPLVDSPHLDAQEEDESFPFMHAGHVTVSPETGAHRTITLWDAPGVTLPIYYDITGSRSRSDWKSENYSPMEAEGNPNLYALYGVGGTLRFLSAVAAYSSDAPYNFVVREIYQFLMDVDAEAPVANLQDPVGDPRHLGIHSVECFGLEEWDSLFVPMDAYEAGLETFAPVATDSGKIYTWTPG